MTQGGSEGSGRPLPPPPVPPRPSKEAVAEAMARSRLTFVGPVPYGRKLLKKLTPEKPPDPPARVYPAQQSKSFKVAKRAELANTTEPVSPTTTERISATFPGIRLNQRDANHSDGARQVIFQSPPPSSLPSIGREKTPPPTLGESLPPEVLLDQGQRPERSEAAAESPSGRPPSSSEAVDQGQPVRRHAEGPPRPLGDEPAAKDEEMIAKEKYMNGNTILDARGGSEKDVSGKLINGHCGTHLSSDGSSDRDFSTDNRISQSDWVELRHGRPVRCTSCRISVGGGEDEDIVHDSVPSGGEHVPDVCYRKYPGGLIAEITRMASLRGLPPLPKSLSGVMDLEGIRLMESEMGAHPRRSVGQGVPDHLSHQGHSSGAGPSSSSQQQDAHHPVSSHRHHQIQPLPTHPMPPHYLSAHQNGSQDQPPPPGRGRKQTSLDAQLALLRQEMVGLRQLDLSLLSQLWSLNESIQEFRVLLQEEQEDLGSALSPPSPSPSPSSGDEDDDDDGNGDFYQPARQQQLHYRQKRQRQQQPMPGEGSSGIKSVGGKSSGSKKSNLYHVSSHNDSGLPSLPKHYTPSSPSTPSSSTRSSFEFGEV